MRPMHETLLASVFAERDRLITRRSLLAGGGKTAAGGMLAATMFGGPLLRSVPVLAQDSMPEFTDDLDVLNYALTLEHLEYAFYRDGVGQFSFGAGPFNEDIGELLLAVRDHEDEHVRTLVEVINSLGGTPVEEAAYDFGYTDMSSFLMTAAALENTGVMAYDGAGAAIEDPGLLTAAGSIVAVEARHASYLNLITGEIPFPSAYETPATRDEILAIAGPFIVS
jgi:hypothetical protein